MSLIVKKLFIAMLICFSALSAETHVTLQYPPYWIIDKDEVYGLHADLAREIFKEAKMEVNFVTYPYARISKLLLPPEASMLAYGSNVETNDKLLFPIPSTNIELCIYSKEINPPTDLESLKGKKIIVLRGFPMGPMASILKSKDHEVIKLDTIEQALYMLKKGRADYVIALDDLFKSVYKKQEREFKVYKSNINTLKGWPIVVLKSHKDSKKIHDKIKKAYESLKKKGIISYKNNRLLLTRDL